MPAGASANGIGPISFAGPEKINWYLPSSLYDSMAPTGA